MGSRAASPVRLSSRGRARSAALDSTAWARALPPTVNEKNAQKSTTRAIVRNIMVTPQRCSGLLGEAAGGTVGLSAGVGRGFWILVIGLFAGGCGALAGDASGAPPRAISPIRASI